MSKLLSFYRVLAAVMVMAILFSAIPASLVTAQEEAPPVLILPIDRATFLPGALFDFRVEVHADEMPADFSVTIDDQDATEFFGAEATQESWEYGPEEGPLTPSQSLVWRGLSFSEPGDHTVAVTAGGETTQVTWSVLETQNAGAKNVILFIADGMSIAEITAARMISRGNSEGKYNGEFAMDQMEEIGLVHTSGMDSMITDSANSASAYNTGHKSAVNALGVYPDTSAETTDDPMQETFAEMVKRTRDMAVGIVTTANWTDATPAAVFAHTRRRSDQNLIAAAPLDTELMPEVILGGGSRHMLAQDTPGSRRDDDRDLFTEYEDAGYTVVTAAADMEAAMETTPPERLLGLFHSNNMDVWLDRNVYTDNVAEDTDQPGLVEMTTTALDVLGQYENGFYLMVEGASVDKQMHPLDYDRAMAELIEFDEAIAAAQAWVQANAPDTLIVVTADHGHGFEVYGGVDVAAFNAATTDDEKREAIGTYADAGFPTYVDADGDHFPDNWAVDRTMAMFVNNFPDYTEDFQVSPVPRVPAIPSDPEDDSSRVVDNPDDDPNGITLQGNLPVDGATTGVHTMQDVPIFASGPGAEFFGHVMDNTEVFFGMAYAIGLDPSAADGLASAVIE
ncbi:MAG: alkaline phosphatase [Anaerolineae bacterium]|nr:alkaline phosphatase [Anaerolineae bacterium]